MLYLRVLLATALTSLLVSCGKAGDDTTATTTPDVRESEQGEAQAAQAGPANEQAEAHGDTTGNDTIDNNGNRVVGPATISVTVELDDDGHAAYKVTLADERGFPVVNWIDTLPDRSHAIEFYVAQPQRRRPPISAANASLIRMGGSIRLRGTVVDSDDAEHPFDFKVDIPGYVTPAPEPGPVPIANNGRHPLADLLDDSVHETPKTLQELIAVVPVPAAPTHQWHRFEQTPPSESPPFFSYIAVTPASDKVTYDYRMFGATGWYLITSVICDREGGLISFQLSQGMTDGYQLLGTSKPLDGLPQHVFSEYYQESDGELLNHLGYTDVDPRRMDALPLPMEPIAFAYHLARGHEKFTIQTTDYTSNFAIIQYTLYERQADETLEIDGQSVSAQVYRMHRTSAATNDRVRGENFGKIETATLYAHPDGRWIRLVAEEYAMHETQNAEVVEVLGLTEETLMRPVPEIED
ncbi:MAG: hypothetical protein ACIAXF_11645 [Phycisphaerales bacterium JB063]